jgi:hypothetical protein
MSREKDMGHNLDQGRSSRTRDGLTVPEGRDRRGPMDPRGAGRKPGTRFPEVPESVPLSPEGVSDMSATCFVSEFQSQFKVFHELMAIKIREMLLVSSPYDAFILEEDGSLASRIINEYSGLNLSIPPRVTRRSSALEALDLLKRKRFDLVITMPHLEEMEAGALALEIKRIDPDLPVILLAHNPRGLLPIPRNSVCQEIDKVFVWSGNSDLLLAIVKNVEDGLNVERDTRRARVRVLILVEDSPVYRSHFLPLIYKEVVKQTQAVLEAGLNEEHRLLTMRARPKILAAENYEQAMCLYNRFCPYLFGIISDARFPRNGKLDDAAGISLSGPRTKGCPRSAVADAQFRIEEPNPGGEYSGGFLDKNSTNLLGEIHDFFLRYLGFGDFIFRSPDGKEIDRADSLRSLQEKLARIPDETLLYHAKRNHFSNWIMSRSEIALASRLRKKHTEDFSSVRELRNYIVSNIQAVRVWRQRGVVAGFSRETFDAQIMDFVRMGEGSLGGKARGLAFMLGRLHEAIELHRRYPDVAIGIPKTLVVATDAFECFVARNRLGHLAEEGIPDATVREAFLRGDFPDEMVRDLETFLAQVRWPLSVRSSSRLEDAHFQPYAGLYVTRMIPNNDADPAVRLRDLLAAIREVYASTFFEGPKAFSRSTGNKHQEEAMGVMIQQLTGRRQGDHFYPALSGVLQSHNYYPLGPMTPEDGVAHVALGLGKTVVEGERSLRFCPRYPESLPQFSAVDDILENAQRYFHALRMTGEGDGDDRLERLEVDDAEDHPSVRALASVYIPEEHRLRDSGPVGSGHRVLTFAPVLKHGSFPLAEILNEVLAMGRRSMGCPVEMEFAVDLSPSGAGRGVFHFLQMRPLVTHQGGAETRIDEAELDRAVCHSRECLGNGRDESMADVLYVRPERFAPEKTGEIAREIGRFNADLARERRPYLLVGPGRWGTSDRWLGIPVQWRDISGVRAMVEVHVPELRVEPSQGSHFFQNITSLGVFYLTVDPEAGDRLDMDWLDARPAVRETENLRHVRLERPLLLKADGRETRCAIFAEAGESAD